ncbi:hypothetical protein BOTBODRAFT_29800, partial [Botryobasidium botryosum FD-172 SS1]
MPLPLSLNPEPYLILSGRRLYTGTHSHQSQPYETYISSTTHTAIPHDDSFDGHIRSTKVRVPRTSCAHLAAERLRAHGSRRALWRTTTTTLGFSFTSSRNARHAWPSRRGA